MLEKLIAWRILSVLNFFWNNVVFSMIKAYHFILDPRIGGPHAYVDSLRRALIDSMESIIVTTGNGALTDIALFNIRHSWKWLYLVEIPINVLLILFFVITGRIKLENTVFNVHGAANLAPLIASWVLRVPVIWHFHETVGKFRFIANVGKFIIKKQRHKLVAVADKSKAVYVLDHAEVIPSSVDPDYWSRAAFDKESDQLAYWNTNSEGGRTLRIVTVGNLNPLKGMDILLAALSDVYLPWHLKIVGSDLSTFRKYTKLLHKQAENIAAGNHRCRVEFTGWRDASYVRLLLETCDLFVLPSRSEACPLSLLEAMSMECLCVATDVGDVRNILSVNGCNNSIVNPDVASLREGIHNAIEMTSEEKKSITSKYREQIVESYSVDKISSVYLHVIRSIIS